MSNYELAVKTFNTFEGDKTIAIQALKEAGVSDAYSLIEIIASWVDEEIEY